MKDGANPAAPVFQRRPLANYEAKNFQYKVRDGVACITLDRPERKNPLTLDSYAELRDLFRAIVQTSDVKAEVLTRAGENFCSRRAVHGIICPLTALDMPGLL